MMRRFSIQYLLGDCCIPVTFLPQNEVLARYLAAAFVIEVLEIILVFVYKSHYVLKTSVNTPVEPVTSEVW